MIIVNNAAAIAMSTTTKTGIEDGVGVDGGGWRFGKDGGGADGFGGGGGEG